MCGHRNTPSSPAWGVGHQQPRAGRKKQGRKSWSQLPAFLLDQPSQSACSSTGSLTVRPQTMEQGWEVAPSAKQVCCFPRPVSSNISLQPSCAPGSTPWATSPAITTGGGRPDHFQADSLSNLCLLKSQSPTGYSLLFPPSWTVRWLGNLFLMFVIVPSAEIYPS